MILFSIIFLFINYIYLFLNIRRISYNGIFLIILLNLLICSNLIIWKIYELWLFNYYQEYCILNWIDLSNNINIYWSVKEDFINNLISFIMIFGASIVSVFVYFEMYNDKEGHNFIILLGYFIVFMLILIGSNDLILFYLGWEGIGLISYFLVNFWSERLKSIKAVIKIFIISKIGDFFIIIFVCFIINLFGTTDFEIINSSAILILNKKFIFSYFSLNEILGLILILGTCIKSAQYGFHIWLLEAMEAPLGASALMHSSTLVISGIILLLKLSIIIEMSTYAQFIMYVMGMLSATMGAFLACFQFELKVILAYSTISNMGYIFILFSLGAYYEMIIILLLHAFIKIYMFLIIGTIIYLNSGSQDIRWMGRTFKFSIYLWINYIIGSLCLIGLPYFSGYYYKYYLLNNLINNFIYLKGGEFFLLISYFFTIFYTFRLGYLVFLNKKNGHKILYKNKKIAIIYIISLLFLGFMILSYHYFWINLLNINEKNLNYSLFYNSYQNYLFILNELTYLSSYIWILIYILIFIFFIILNIIKLNNYIYYLKNWLILINFFSIFYLYVIY